ncbi:stage II sporulation protein Q [Anoxybacillus vitaminiphilus]|uniref:Stage II sporulation protein Q n=1 Tax=Paranoxybacillus vitaminiphilus TaxID=581036 RepID=A0A327YQM7_9BACL|nr:M23 family metallopeptidase [Anoxybacillus vitaminiphilus]RAK20419.1 stage II sporulation protein Q [Anoxybacillus vitaminiphilus]
MREEEKKQPSPMKPSLRRAFRKRWVVPAIYLASAALILTGVLWFQSKDDNKTAENEHEYNSDMPGTSYNDKEPAVPVNEAVERFAIPVLDPNAVEIQKPFYDSKASKEEQEAALVFYNNTYHQNKGIDIAMKDGKSFDVTASLSGTVTKAKKDPIFGYVAEIEHDEGVVTVYQSLAELKVKAGDTVKQGQVIGKAGQSQFNQEAGIHAHFEIRKDNQAVNPIDYFDQPLTALTEEADEQTKQAEEENATEQNAQTTDEKQTQLDEETQSEEQSTNENTTTPTEQHSEQESYKTPDTSIGMART